MKNRSSLLDIIKGVMIIFIITTHFRFIYPDDYRKFGFFFWIDMAVPVFMIITGYLMTIQFERKKITTLQQAWALEIVIPKLLRFIVPFIFSMMIELPFLAVNNGYGIVDIITILFRGGEGPGSYYTQVLIQLVFFFPLIYLCIKKYDFFGVVLSFVITAIWEAVQYSWGTDGYTYSLLMFRYISILAFGSYIAIGKIQANGSVLTSMFFVGAVWQALLNYVPLEPIFMNVAWARVNYIPTLFIMPIMYVLIKKFNNSEIRITILQELGKASYNIYLTQMVFYGCGKANLVYSMISLLWLQLIICITVCVVAGYIFYRIETPITSRIIDYVKQHDFFRGTFAAIADKCNCIAGK